MKNFIKYIIMPIYIIIIGISSSAATPLIHHTLPAIELEPDSFVSNIGIKTAAIYWLPDYQRKLTGRTETAAGGDPDRIGKCGTYGFMQSCGYPKISTGTIKPHLGLTCQKSCICPSSYRQKLNLVQTEHGANCPPIAPVIVILARPEHIVMKDTSPELVMRVTTARPEPASLRFALEDTIVLRFLLD